MLSGTLPLTGNCHRGHSRLCVWCRWMDTCPDITLTLQRTPLCTHMQHTCPPPAPPSTLSPPGAVHMPEHISHMHAQACLHTHPRTRDAYFTVPRTHTLPAMPPSECMRTLTGMHALHMYVRALGTCICHIYPITSMPHTVCPPHAHMHTPHSRKAPVCSLTQPPSPHSSLCPMAQFGLACTCMPQGDTDTWHTPIDTSRPHTPATIQYTPRVP